MSDNIFTLKIAKMQKEKVHSTQDLKLSSIDSVLKHITRRGYNIEIIAYEETIKNKLLEYSCFDIDLSSSIENKALCLVTDNSNELLYYNLFDNIGEINNVLFVINSLKNRIYFKNFYLSNPYYGIITNVDNIFYSSERISYQELADISNISLAGLMQIFQKGEKYQGMFDLITMIDKEFLMEHFKNYRILKRGAKSQEEINRNKKIFSELLQ